MSANGVRDALAADMSEDELLANIRAEAKRTGWLCYHTHRSDRSEPGFPDLVLLRNGRMVVTELKAQKAPAPKGKQALWLESFVLVQCAISGLINDEYDIETVVGDVEPLLGVYIWRPSEWYAGAIQQVLA